MRFRFWAAEALSGDIVGEFRMTGRSSWVSRFGGGTFGADVSVSHLQRRNDETPDWGAVERVRSGARAAGTPSSCRRVCGPWASG